MGIINYSNDFKNMYENYILKYKVIDFEDMSVGCIAGYFLTVHSINPISNLNNYVKDNRISNKKADKVRVILDLV